ncbi:MAG: putative zinc-binding protein [Armatimonadota bacterium]|nr:putative zinc-binding protein [Armatimonadota bacterium]
MDEPDAHGGVGLLVCGGIGRIVSTVVRQAAYMVAGDRPDSVVLVSSGSLTGEVAEALETARSLPLIAVDACEERCASALVEGRGLKAEEIIWLPRVSAKHRLSIRGEDRKGLSEKGMRLARALADEIIERVDAVASGEGD